MAAPTIPEDVIAARIEKGKELLEIERQLTAEEERRLTGKMNLNLIETP